MKMTDMFLAQLEREVPATRRTLERVPEGRNDWKPHPKSMPLGYLAALVARMPGWLAMTIKTEQLALDSPEGSKFTLYTFNKTHDLLHSLDDSAAEARQALTSTNDEHLMKPWRLTKGAQVLYEQPRHIALSDTVFSHLAHHRGQLTVYLRMNEASVPAIYGPSADEGK